MVNIQFNLIRFVEAKAHVQNSQQLSEEISVHEMITSNYSVL